MDGNYENGELINGSIYHSEAEAVEGVKQDRIMARTIANSSESEPDLARIYPQYRYNRGGLALQAVSTTISRQVALPQALTGMFIVLYG